MGGPTISISRYPVSPWILVGYHFGSPWFNTGKEHTGWDVHAVAGQPVYAMADGVVHNHVVDPKWGYGVIIDHGGWGATYWHVDHFLPDGAQVRANQQVATVYDLGKDTHLHVGTWVGAYDENLDRGALYPAAFPDHFVDPDQFIRGHYGAPPAPAPPTLEDDMGFALRAVIAPGDHADFPGLANIPGKRQIYGAFSADSSDDGAEVKYGAFIVPGPGFYGSVKPSQIDPPDVAIGPAGRGFYLSVHNMADPKAHPKSMLTVVIKAEVP